MSFEVLTLFNNLLKTLHVLNPLCSQGMPEHLVQQASNRIPPRFGGTSENDIFLMIKAFVSDTELCQDVLVVWPGTMVNDTMGALRRIASNQVPGRIAKKRFSMFKGTMTSSTLFSHL